MPKNQTPKGSGSKRRSKRKQKGGAITAEFQGLLAKLDTEIGRVGGLGTKIKELTDKKATLEKSKASNEKEIQGLTSQISELTAKSSELEKVQAALNTAQDQIADAASASEDAKAQHEALQAQVKSEGEAVAAARVQIDAISGELATQKKLLQNQNAGFAEGIAAVDSKIGELTKSISSAEGAASSGPALSGLGPELGGIPGIGEKKVDEDEDALIDAALDAGAVGGGKKRKSKKPAKPVKGKAGGGKKKPKKKGGKK